MRKFLCATVYPFLISACATPLPVPDDKILQAETSRHDVAAAQIVAKRRTVDEQLEELHKLLAEMTAEFVLGPGDLLSISVYAEPDLTIDAAPVRPDGWPPGRATGSRRSRSRTRRGARTPRHRPSRTAGPTSARSRPAVKLSPFA